MNGIQRLLAPMDGAPGSRSWSLKKDHANSPSVVEIKHSEHNKQTVGEITGNIMYTIPICQTYLAVIFLIQSSHSIPPQNGIWTIYQAKENI